MATFDVTSTTTTSISVAVTGLSTGFNRTRWFHWYANGYYWTKTSLDAYGGSIYYTYHGLTPGAFYNLSVKIYDSDDSTLFATLSGSGTTNTAITPWSWTTAELNAFNNKGNFSVLTASRWNDFCDKINETCIAAGSSWITTYTTLSGTKASGSGATLTALMFNSARLNIGARVSTGIAEVSTGDTIYGWYFVTLQDKLNQWIASL